jgi:hypothetical protein
MEKVKILLFRVGRNVLSRIKVYNELAAPFFYMEAKFGRVEKLKKKKRRPTRKKKTKKKKKRKNVE